MSTRALRAVVFAAVVATCAVTAVAGDDLESRAFVEVVSPRDTYFVGQPIRLRLRFGFAGETLRENLVPVFRRRLDVPVQIEAPWWTALPGTRATQDTDTRGGQTFALDDDVARATRKDDAVHDGRPCTVFEIERTYLPLRAGQIRVPAPVLRFAFATAFEEDFLNGRVPTDRQDGVVVGDPLDLTIRELPDGDRPEGFVDAVGSFSVRARTAAREVDVGETFELVLRIEGQGNLAALTPPRLDDVTGFHLYGSIDDGIRPGDGSPVRTIRYDLAAVTADLAQIPAITFAYFDPGPPAVYRTAQTAPIPLAVRAAPGKLPSRSNATPTGPPDDTRSDGTGAAAVITALAIALCIGAGLWLRRLARRPPVDPTVLRARAAGAVFRETLDGGDVDLAKALATYLAVHLGCKPAAVISPDLPARLARGGVPRDLASRTSGVLERLVASRYGGETDRDPGPVRDLVRELERWFTDAL